MKKIKDKSGEWIVQLDQDEVKIAKRNLITKLVRYYFVAFINLMAAIVLIAAIKFGSTYFLFILVLINSYFVVFNLREIITLTSLYKKITAP